MKFVAFERAKQGTGASRRLRNTGKTPGTVYGGEGQPLLIELDHNALWHALKKEAFHSTILEMELAGATSKVLLRDVQYHPYKQQVQHVDFQRVDANTKLHMKVPLHYKGAEESDAVKLDHCLVNPGSYWQQVQFVPRTDWPRAIERCNGYLGEQLDTDRLHPVALADLSDPAGAVAQLEIADMRFPGRADITQRLAEWRRAFGQAA